MTSIYHNALLEFYVKYKKETTKGNNSKEEKEQGMPKRLVSPWICVEKWLYKIDQMVCTLSPLLIYCQILAHAYLAMS